MMAQMLDLGTTERKVCRVKEMNTELDERDKEKKEERRDRMCADLRCYLVQTENPCEHNYQDRREPHGWVEPNDDPHSQAPSQATGRHASPQLAQKRPKYFAPQELANELG